MDPIITPIVGLAAGATISEIADITTIAEGLLTLWSTVKGIVEKNRSVKDRIDRAINKAKQKVSSRHWFDQPILISNLDILKNVLHKANNEELEISDAQTIDVFNDIYDEIINNKEFWEILQSLLTEHRFEIINGKAEEIQRKVDEVIAQIKAVVIAIEKANLSIDELRPYYPLDKELFINEEENRKLYRDEALIEKIHQNLDSRHVYLIQSSEGRGKTTLCRIIASDYYSQDTKVYFVDLKSNDGIDKIRKCCIEWNKTKTKTLLVLENIHASGDLEALVSMINTYKADLRFLLNARPTESEYAMYLKELGEDNIFDLRPLPEYCEGVARCLCKDKPISEGDLPSFISKKIYSKTNQQNAGANLRLLRIYCSVWNEGNYGSILDIREHDILEKFKSTYGLRTASKSEKNALLYLSCMYQFDVPLQEELLTDEDSDGLQGFYNKGLCTSFDGKFYLPHSVDAALLCKAICGYNQYIGKTSEMVKNKYINTILTSNNPRKFEGDFRLLRHGLIERKDEFQILINELADWPMAKRIISNIDPSFIITAFDTRNGHTKETILSSYTKDKEIVLPYILELSPGKLNQLWNLFENFLKYNDFYLDVFENPDILQRYLMKWYKLLNTTSSLRVLKDGIFKKKIMDISQKHALIIHYKPPIRNTYRFNTIPPKKTRFFIFNRSVAYLYTTNATDFERFLRQINKKKGFYFKNCSWTHLGKMIHIIQSKSNDSNRNLCFGAEKKIIQAIVKEINKDLNAMQKATNEELSRFFYAVSDFDKTMFDSLMKNGIIITDAKFRLSWFDYSFSEFNLFSHFYSQPWCKAKMNELIDQANTEQKIVIKGWHDKVITKLHNNAEQIEKDSLLDYIHNKPFIQQQNN